ncbi:hypothetical protein FBU59_000364 [Linderina macrospora]|uniref:Uncharacterized protein n=1 Tax=Linderina macrospora TaxID=4868 RepID=A0ACC1JHE6_9FUNG|nr:hypothetical protein FBU59_000364 [Linderina macrospora]
MGLPYDPVGNADKAIVYFGIVFYSITFLLLLYCWANWSYRPIRAKNLPVITFGYVFDLLWFIGDIQANQNVRVVGVWSHCKGWGIWVHMLATYSFSAAVLFRKFALDRVYNRQKPCRGWGFYGPILGFFVSLLAFCLTVQFVSDKKTITYDSDLAICLYSDGLRYGSVGLIWIVWIVTGIYVVRIRRIKSGLNEFRESLIIYIIAVLCLIQYTVCHAAFKALPLQQTVRCLITALDLIAVNLTMWVFLAYPAYQRMFHREQYLSLWLKKLSRDEFRRGNQLAASHKMTERRIPDSPLQGNRGHASSASVTHQGDNDIMDESMSTMKFLDMQSPYSYNTHRNGRHEDASFTMEYALGLDHYAPLYSAAYADLGSFDGERRIL